MSIDTVSTAIRLASAVAAPVFRALGRRNTHRFAPEPRNSLGQDFDNTMNGVARALDGGSGDAPSGELLQLLNKQIEAQKRMQVISMSSNIEKSKHEMNMSPIRNIRVQ